MGKYTEEIDAKEKARKILLWSIENKWFDSGFIKRMVAQNSFSIGQIKAINKIYNKMIEGENEKSN